MLAGYVLPTPSGRVLINVYTAVAPDVSQPISYPDGEPSRSRAHVEQAALFREPEVRNEPVRLLSGGVYVDLVVLKTLSTGSEVSRWQGQAIV